MYDGIILSVGWVDRLWGDLQQMGIVEVLAVITGIIYVVLAARQQISCWFFGIISSLLSIYLFATGKLYAESFLYSYYVLAGIYGWYNWGKGPSGRLPIAQWTYLQHFLGIVLGLVLAFWLGKMLSTYTDAAQPYVDAHTTIFSFIATYLTTKKILENWLYWIVIDAVSVWLYADRGFILYAVLMIAYTVIAAMGYREWKRKFDLQTIS